MPITEAKKKSNKKYDQKTYDQVTVRIKKYDMEKVKQIIGDGSVNGFINQAIIEKLERNL